MPMRCDCKRCPTLLVAKLTFDSDCLRCNRQQASNGRAPQRGSAQHRDKYATTRVRSYSRLVQEQGSDEDRTPALRRAAMLTIAGTSVCPLSHRMLPGCRSAQLPIEWQAQLRPAGAPHAPHPRRGGIAGLARNTAAGGTDVLPRRRHGQHRCTGATCLQRLSSSSTVMRCMYSHANEAVARKGASLASPADPECTCDFEEDAVAPRPQCIV